MHVHYLQHLNSSLLFGVAGSTFIVFALPLIAKLVGPNRWYGFRVEKTLSNTQIWYEANRIAGIDLLIAGVIVISTAVFTSTIQQRSADFPVASTNLIVLIISLLACVTHSLWALQRIK